MPLYNKRPCRLFIFDLDGTLIDSRADIVNSLNRALMRLEMAPLQEERIAGFVGDGTPKLVERALRETTGLEPESTLTRTAIQVFREEYGNHLLDQTRLCHQAMEALNLLTWAKFAVVTNKPEDFSRRILKGLGIEDCFSIILGGDSVQNRKPDPEALRIAMDFCQILPSETAMVGDSIVDILAGKSAGVTTCGILGGFRPSDELKASGCDLIIASLTQLADHFCPPEN